MEYRSSSWDPDLINYWMGSSNIEDREPLLQNAQKPFYMVSCNCMAVIK
jgi:hypothetical protein